MSLIRYCTTTARHQLSAAVAWALLVISSLGAQDMSKMPITNVIDALKLSAVEASSNAPVRLRATVTCYIPASQLCFVQDETAGIYVLPAIWQKDLEPGDIVDVQGVTGTGRFSPIVQWGSLKKTGGRSMPEAKKVAIEDLNTGKYDSQWVQIEGVVQGVSTGNEITTMQVWTGGSSATVMAFSLGSSPTNLIDASVRVEGVAGTFYQENRLSGFGVFVSSANQIHLLSPAPVEPPLRPLRSLAWFSRDSAVDHRIRVQGTVTVFWPGEAIFLQGESSGLRINVSSTDDSIRIGDSVEASGFIRDLTANPRLDSGTVRKLAASSVPEPARLTLVELVSRRPTGQYVAVDGIVTGVRSADKALWLLEIEESNRTATVISQKQFTGVRPGARVRATGAWSAPPPELRNELGPVLWRDRSTEMAVLAPPKPVEPSQASPLPGSHHAALWAAAVGAALLLAGAIAIRARRNVATFAQEKATEAQRLADAEIELERVNEARERLGRDLHDRIIQSIYAIGLNIDDCAQSAGIEPEKLQGRLRSALGEVNGVITELRNVILGLETNAIQPGEFRTALKSLGLALGDEKSNRIRLAIDDDALSALTPGQATELVHIAREAMSNSIRHGGAQTTTFVLELRGDKIRFFIEDDGVGFDPKKVEGRGFGLRNMAKRADQLGANFSIRSEEGHGTRVVLDIPRKKQHFSTNEPRARIDR